ncbi:MAG: sulfatase [Verrucomicrobiota bacterium]
MKLVRQFLATLLFSSLLAAKPNILFIAVDDLRPELNCYGASHIHSPNIDALAQRGTLFERAYCQVAVCGASRASIMTGLRPETTRCWTYYTPMREKNPDALSLPQHFKNHGYTTLSFGKIYHATNDDYPLGWSEKPLKEKGSTYASQENLNALKKLAQQNNEKERLRGPSHENPGNLPDNVYADGTITEKSIARLEQLAAADTPFFLAVGFQKPHLPFNAPGKYWEIYDPEKIKTPSSEDRLNGIPHATSFWGELKSYPDIPSNRKVLSPEKSRTLIHGYYACVSYIDSLIGQLLNSLDRLSLSNNTIIVLWGDHGFYLGEFGDWCKHTNYEVATHVPLIISTPGGKPNQRTPALTEFVDVFPTLADLAGLPIPPQLQGTSLTPLLENPSRTWREAAFSQYEKNKRGVGLVLGTSVRTHRFRYTEWRRKDNPSILEDISLIDFQTDPKALKNIAQDPQYATHIKHLAELAKSSRTGLKPN